MSSAAPMDLPEGKGAFSPGTVGRKTVNYYDSTNAHFSAMPTGPFEAPEVAEGGQPRAHEHFDATREIKLKEPLGDPLPLPTYTHHYPPKEIPAVDKGLALSPGTVPFTARSEHNDEFEQKPRMGRPVEPLTYTHKPAPWMGHQTSNQATFKPFTYSTEKTASPGRPAHGPPADMPFDYSTTHRTQFVPKDAMGREPTAVPELRPQQPWMASGTTYGSTYVPKEFALQPVGETQYNPYPFDGTTEYRGEYVPKEPLPQVPPLTGIVSKDGLQLPLPRRSLGVEYWHKGKSDQFYMLIPRHTAAPCTAVQTFTTLHDNQEQACILVLYGDDPVASNNLLLGQFDIVNIPPAPKDVPRIEVKLHLSKNMLLTAEARDLDAARHKLWIQNDTIIELRK